MLLYKFSFSQTRRIAERICDTSKAVTALGKASFYAQMALEKKQAYRFVIGERKWLCVSDYFLNKYIILFLISQ